MQNSSDESISEIRFVDFGSIPVDTVCEKYILIQNTSDKFVTYRVSLLYILNSIDQVYTVSITSTPVRPQHNAEITIRYRPNVVGLINTEYYIIDDTHGNSYRLTITGKSFGPEVKLSKKKITFRICKNVSEQRKETISIVNKACVDTTYQWLLPYGGQGYFQISTGNCGLIRADETIATTITFTGVALGIYTAELVLLVLNQVDNALAVLRMLRASMGDGIAYHQMNRLKKNFVLLKPSFVESHKIHRVADALWALHGRWKGL